MEKLGKTINVSKETWLKLQRLKLNKGHGRLNEVIDELIKNDK